MPLARIVTSAATPEPEKRRELLGALSRLLAERLGKPESYVMTCLEPSAAMTFGGQSEPCAYVEIKNVGRFTETQTRELSAALCPLVASALGLGPDRVYIEFSAVEGYLWGYDSDTFG